MQSMQHPTHPEAHLLIRMKRERAKTAMDQIVKRFSVISNEPEPGLEVLLDYLTNMVYALELLLKVMSNDWRKPGRSMFGHRVGEMYQEVFGRPHARPDLMAILERAILNQKFIYGPADRLMDNIPELESLWDELAAEFCRCKWMEDTTVQCEVVAPPAFIQFLRNNLPRFYKAEKRQWSPQLPREHRIQMLQHEILALQNELSRVQSSEEPPEETLMQNMQVVEREYLKRLQGAAGSFDFNSEMRHGKYAFGTWNFGKVLPGCLG